MICVVRNGYSGYWEQYEYLRYLWGCIFEVCSMWQITICDANVSLFQLEYCTLSAIDI